MVHERLLRNIERDYLLLSLDPNRPCDSQIYRPGMQQICHVMSPQDVAGTADCASWSMSGRYSHETATMDTGTSAGHSRPLWTTMLLTNKGQYDRFQ